MLLDQIDASVIATDMTGIVISWNHGAETLYGWSAEEAVGRNARELVVPEDAAAGRTPDDGAEPRRPLGRRAARAPQGRHALHDLRSQPARARREWAGRRRSSAWPSTSPPASLPRPSCATRATTRRPSPSAWARASSRSIGEGRITYVNRVAEDLLGRRRGRAASAAKSARWCTRPGPTAPSRRSSSARSRARFAARTRCGSTTTGSAPATAGEMPVAYTATPFADRGRSRGLRRDLPGHLRAQAPRGGEPAQRRDARGDRPRRARARR